MPKMIQHEKVFQFSLEDVKILMANDLNVPVKNISVNYVLKDNDPDSYGSNYKVDSINVTVKMDEN